MSKDYKTHQLGNWKLRDGGEIKDAFLAYKTYGEPSNPVILQLTWYTGTIAASEWLVGEGKPLDPAKYYIILIALIGNSESISPSNRKDVRPWPFVTFYDNVRAQHNLVTEGLGVKHVFAVLGFSMGAGQTYQWVTQYPDFMDVAIPLCGSAKTSPHNQVFLEGVKTAIIAPKGGVSAGINKGEAYPGGKPVSAWSKEERATGLKAMGRVYAGWAISQAFYRENLHVSALKYKDTEDFLVKFWEEGEQANDPDDALAMLYTWQSGDCSNQEPYNGDFAKAMQGIKAKILVMPCRTDLYFPPEDSEIEVKHMRDGIGKLDVIESVWGHMAGGGINPEDAKYIFKKYTEFFQANGGK